MKNAKEFNDAKYSTLTQHEWDELERLVIKICDNHDNDEWWKVDNGIKTCVNSTLIRIEAEEEFEELKEMDLEEIDDED